MAGLIYSAFSAAILKTYTNIKLRFNTNTRYKNNYDSLYCLISKNINKFARI